MDLNNWFLGELVAPTDMKVVNAQIMNAVQTCYGNIPVVFNATPSISGGSISITTGGVYFGTTADATYIANTGTNVLACTIPSATGITLVNANCYIYVKADITTSMDNRTTTVSPIVYSSTNAADEGIKIANVVSSVITTIYTVYITPKLATTTQFGIVQLATNAQATARTSTTTVLTPSNLDSAFSGKYPNLTNNVGTQTVSATGTGGFTTTAGAISSFSSVTAATSLNSATLAVTGNGTVGGTFGVTGNFTVTTGTTSLKGTTVTGTLGVTSNATVGGTFGVTGASTFTGNITANGALTVSTGATSLKNTTVTGTFGVTGLSSLATLSTSGLATLNTLTVSTGASNLKNTVVTGTLSVSAGTSLAALSATNITASGTLGVTGISTFGGNITANGNFTVSSGTSNLRNTTITGTLGVTSNATVGGTFGVTGLSTIPSLATRSIINNTSTNSTNPAAQALIGDFASTSSANGSINLPGGLIFKWGAISLTASGSTVYGSVSFSGSFPNGVYRIIPGVSYLAQENYFYTSWFRTDTVTTSGFTMGVSTNRPGSTTMVATYFAIGH